MTVSFNQIAIKIYWNVSYLPFHVLATVLVDLD
jgi:hypothetical protein